MRLLPNLDRAMKRAAQWRLLLWWMLLMLTPTMVLLLPVWQTFSAQLDHTIHAAEWARHWDVVMLSDVLIAAQAGQGAFAGSGAACAGLLLALIPLLNGLFIAASRSDTPLGLGEMLREAVPHYWRNFRLMLVALAPLALGALVLRLLEKGVSNYADQAILASRVEQLRWGALVLGAIVFALANATVDAARASLALEPDRRSAVIAWWHGLKLVVRHPLRSVLLYLLVTMLAAIGLALAFVLRLEVRSANLTGLVLGLLIAQLISAIMAWMHYARMFGMLELTRALKAAPSV